MLIVRETRPGRMAVDGLTVGEQTHTDTHRAICKHLRIKKLRDKTYVALVRLDGTRRTVEVGPITWRVLEPLI